MSSWFITANNNIFDHHKAFKEEGFIDWSDNRRKKIKQGDIVYIYAGKPISKVQYQCEVVKTNITFTDHHDDRKYWVNPENFKSDSTFLRLKLIKKNDVVDMNPAWLLKYGIIKDMANLSTSGFEIKDKNALKAFEDVFSTIIKEERVINVIPSGEINQEIMSQDSSIHYWIYAAGKNSSSWDDLYKHSVIGVAWNDLGEFKQFKSRKAIQSALNNGSNIDSKNDSLAIYEFTYIMKPGDIVFVKRGLHEIIGRGEVISDYYYDSQFPGFHHLRKINWTHNESHHHESQIVQKTLTDITKYNNEKHGYYANYLESLFKGKDTRKANEDKILPGELKAINKIYYGVPGSGKSWKVEQLIKGHTFKRVTFFPEYQNSDFIGQLMPSVKNGDISYEFIPGPFTELIVQAIKSPQKDFYLVIEELNRGNAPAIFGELFQLLDRKNHISEYEISLPFMIRTYFQKFGINDQTLRLPNNFYILATMNTSDQNVFTLDTAFKRRWIFEQVSNNFDSTHPYKNKKLPGLSLNWENFRNVLNEKIMSNNTTLTSFDDKQIGPFFIKEDELDNIDIFTFKIFEYIWNDVSRHTRNEWFPNNKTLEDVIEKYKKKELIIEGVLSKDDYINDSQDEFTN